MKNIKVGVLGAGVMGRGIVYSLAKKGIEVFVWNRKNSKRVYEGIDKLLNVKVSAGKISNEDRAKMLSCIHVLDQFNDFEKMDIVIESIVEDFDIKVDVLRKLCALKTFQFVATNTSSLSIAKLEQAIDSNNFIGLHFFNPPSRLNFVEIIVTERTSTDVLDTCKHFCDFMENSFIVVPDKVGSIVNRILSVSLNEAAKIYTEANGAIDFADVDKAMCEGALFPMGLFAMADLIGLDVCVQMLENFNERFHREAFVPEELWSSFIRENKLGKKTQQGFRSY